MRRGGTADLPLHGGRVPRWLAERMTRLGTAVARAVVEEHGAAGFLSRLSDPFWFQSLGCLMGMDWHSSGITTSVMGALKRGLNPLCRELGITVCGGRGRHSLKTPQELEEAAARSGLDGAALVRASRLAAKVDNSCLQDGFAVYLHCFVLVHTGEWAVVQQGMNPQAGLARRYHWHSPRVRSFVSDPQAAVVGAHQGLILNLSDGRAEGARSGIVELLREHPDRQLRELRRLVMPARHEILPVDVDSRRLGAVLALAYERQCRGFAEALLVPGIGPRTLQALALAAEVIFGAPSRFQDPARFAFAHGGKDGHPFPVLTHVYDRTVAVLRAAVERAPLERSERLFALRRLSGLARAVEAGLEPRVEVERLMARERSQSSRYGGRTAGGKRAGPGERGGGRPASRGGETSRGGLASGEDRQLYLF